MEAFPHLVEMHKKFADKGLVIITVSLDDFTNEDLVAGANKFLKRVNPPFVKLLLQESTDFWSKKFDFETPPCYFVFDRNGQWVRFRASDYAEDVNYHDLMDKAIIRMLNEP